MLCLEYIWEMVKDAVKEGVCTDVLSFLPLALLNNFNMDTIRLLCTLLGQKASIRVIFLNTQLLGAYQLDVQLSI